MAKNNHFNSDNKKRLDELLRLETQTEGNEAFLTVMNYARALARIENALVVVSDMADGRSHIIAGSFANRLGITDHDENSIWESRVLSLMTPQEQEDKYIAELRFFHYVRHLPRGQRKDYCLVSKLRLRFADGTVSNVLHRMFYVYDDDCETVRFAICIYGPSIFDFNGRSRVVNTVTGISEELTDSKNNDVLSRRECQVLTLIYTGMKSAEIAAHLNISIHTVSRHRQEIISKLQVKNSHEACRLAKSMKLI